MSLPTANPNITYRVAYEDDALVVVEKPSRRPVQPGKGHEGDTLLNGLFSEFGQTLQNLGQARDFGLVHRLDKDTSGLLVIALQARAYDGLREAFANREVAKYYWAVCAKPPSTPTGVIKLAIAETPGGEVNRDRVKTAFVNARGKPAVTAYRVLDESDVATLIEARPVTGRLHQVRVHLDTIGCPILGDPYYGPKASASSSPRLALHAHRLAFDHPLTGERVDVSTAWPRDLRRLLKNTRLRRPDLPADEADEA